MPLVTFYQLLNTAAATHMAIPRPPQRADVDVGGSIPAKALRYCEAIRTANAYGYHLYFPLDLSLRFDGATIEGSIDEDGRGSGINWWPLDKSVFYPGFPEHFKEIAPDYLQNFPPPLATPGETHGLVQLWCGSIARTEEGWSLLVRGPVNDSRRSMGYEILEGIIETDHWGGHLFANIRLLTDRPVKIHAHHPFIQVVPVHRSAYGNILDDIAIHREVPDDVWRAYGDVVIGKYNGTRPLGAYATEVRKRRASDNLS
jgi:hypothetical protein